MGRLIPALTATAITAVAAFILIPATTTTPTPQTAVAAPLSVADRYRAADQIDRSTRDPLPQPEPFTTPTNPPPEPEPAVVAPVAAPQAPPADTGGLPALLLTIRANESGGNYQAFNPTGCEGYGCGGAYQLHAGYASGWAAEAGYPGLPGNAALWDPATQDAVALYKFYATNPDGALWCSWTDYC